MLKLHFKNKLSDILVKTGIVLLSGLILAALAVLIINAAMMDSTSANVLDIPELDGESIDCVLVLGAGLKSDGTPSHMLEDRLIVAAEVLNAVGADCILMSGDDSGEHYNEPAAMKEYVLGLGVSEDKIILDGQGFSTYESITRAKQIYGFDNIIVITQEYHLYRALYIADQCDIEAVGVSADLRPYQMQVVRDVREILARVKDFFQCK